MRRAVPLLLLTLLPGAGFSQALPRSGDSCVECDRALRKTLEALQAWRRAHGGSYPQTLGDLAAAGLSPLRGLGCPLAAEEANGASATHNLVSSKADGFDPSLAYEYELSPTPLEQFRGYWVTPEPPTRRDHKSELLRRKFHNEVPILRCPSHRLGAPTSPDEGRLGFRNATDDGSVYWSGNVWETRWIEDVPTTCRQPLVLLGQPGPPFFTAPVPDGCGFVDLSHAANAFASWPWWWGAPQLVSHEKAPDLAALFDSVPDHRLALSGGRYWLDGIIQLQGRIDPSASGSTAAPSMRTFPWSCEAIRIDRFFRSARWLQGSAYLGTAGQPAGSLVWRYEDQTSEIVQIVYGRDTARFWPETGAEAASPKPVWAKGDQRRVYEQTWTNPHPGKMVSTLDFISNKESTASPFIIAISLDP